MKQRAVIICPGRGTYNAPELGYLARHHSHQSEVISTFDDVRRAGGQASISSFDAATAFDPETHTRGDVASSLIYACGYLDALSISDDFDIVAVTGNSMGWYTALAVAGAVSPVDGFRIADTMGQLMQRHMIGGQVVYPFVDETWSFDTTSRKELLALVAQINARYESDLSVSIELGGMLVLAGNESGLVAFETAVPKSGVFPMRLKNHAAFHSHLQETVAKEGQHKLGDVCVNAPDLPLIDGLGRIWWPSGFDKKKCLDYTLGQQVTTTYDFSLALSVAAKEFSPDVFIICGPGTTLGGAVAQSLIQARWKGMKTKTDFQSAQDKSGFLISMGRPEQRKGVT